MTTETKYEKFVRLAEKRVPKMTEAMRLVSQLSSTNYETTPDAVKTLGVIFDDSVIQLYAAFNLPLPTVYRGADASSSKKPVTVDTPAPDPVSEVAPEAPVDHNGTTNNPHKIPMTEDIIDGANYDLPEWGIVKEAYALLCNLSSQDDLDKATRLIKSALKA